MANVASLLERKGNFVCCIAPSETVLESVERMNRHKIGAVVVTVDDRVVGMFTERDVLTRVLGEQRDPAATLVEEVMTTDVAYAKPETDIDEVGAVMKMRRIRHLPVCDDMGRLLGLVSIGDVNAWYADGLDAEIHYLQEYIHGRV